VALTYTQGFTLNGNGGTIDQNGINSTFSGVLSDAPGQTGTLAIMNSGVGGSVTFSGINTYTGGTVFNGGTLKVGADNNLGAASGALTFGGGTLQNTATFGTARAVTLNAGGGTFNTDPATTLTLNGSISGSGALTKAGTGTLVLAGDNSGGPAHTPGTGWTGGMVINAGLVQVTNPWGLGWGGILINGGTLNTTVDILTGQTIALAGNTTLNTDAGTTTILTGTLVTAGSGSCLVKSGLGALNMTGNATLANGTCVQQGTLFANGILNGDVNVGAGATLRGGGTINGAVNVAGTLAPGNSPGFLTAAGSVTMASGSTFQEDIAGTIRADAPGFVSGATGYYSFLHVTGANQFVINPGATLSPRLQNLFSPLEAGYGSPSYTPAIGDTFRMVTADGGISGRFSTVAQPSGLATGTRLAVFYGSFGSNSIDSIAIPSSYGAWLGGGNWNTRSAASALDRILALDQAGGATTAQDQLLYVTATQRAAALPGFARALAGEVHGALAAVAPQAGQWLQGSVVRHLATASGTAVEQPSDDAPGHALWIDASSNYSHWQADDFASGFSSDRAQFAVGADVILKKDNRLGVGLSHATTNVSATVGSGSVEETMAFVYGQHAYTHFVVDALAGYGASTTDSQRADPTGLGATLKTSQGGRNTLLSAGVRAPWVAHGTTFEPFARVMWQKARRDAFTEGSAVAALSFPDYSAEGVRTMVGISGNSEKNDPLATRNTYQFRIGVGQDSGALVHPTIQASLAGMNTGIAAPQVGRAFVQANVQGTVRLDPRAYAYGGLTGEARSGKSDLGANVGLNIGF
jgi:autotransporter-associated beta strand protein